MNRNKKRVTLQLIAQEAQVSVSTVSFVLNNAPNIIRISDATRARVVAAAEKLGYRPNAAARSLVTGKSHTVLMVLFDWWDENLAERIRGVEAHLVPQGYTLRMCTVDADTGIGAFSQIVQSGQADGVLLSGLARPHTYELLSNLYTEAHAMNIPVTALIDAFPRHLVDAVVDIDEKTGAKDAVTHLIQHGHRRILFLGVNDQQWSENRELGYRAALEKARLPLAEELIVCGNVDQAWAYDVTSKLVRTLDFTAMFAATDIMAIAALAALKTAGKRVPEDIAVIGFDNYRNITPFTDPPLTSVENPFFETGRSAARALLNLMHQKPARSKPLPVSLVVRSSCGCTPENSKLKRKKQ